MIEAFSAVFFLIAVPAFALALTAGAAYLGLKLKRWHSPEEVKEP